MPDNGVYYHHPAWAGALTRLVKSEMAARGVRYQQLSERLHALGVDQSAENLKVKINRGNFGAQLLLQIMRALAAKNIDLERVCELVHELETEIAPQPSDNASSKAHAAAPRLKRGS